MKGTGPNEGRSAVVECKGGATQTTLACLKVDKTGKRCMSEEWVLDRLDKAGHPELIEAYIDGKLDFFVTLEGSGEVWKINPKIYQTGTKSATKRVGAATRVFP